MDISSISAMYSDYARSNADATTNKVSNLTKADYSKATDEQLMDACKQFEAYFVEQVFKEVAKTIPTTEYTSVGTTTMMDYYKDEMVKKLSEMTTEQESLGLAQMLYEQMKRNYDL